MKKCLAFLLVVIVLMSLAFSGCGKAKEGGQEDATTAKAGESTREEATTSAVEEKNVTIKFWIYPMIKGVNGDGNGEFDDWAKDRGTQFSAKHPKAKLEVELLNWQNSLEKIDVAVASGATPDLVYTINNFGGVSKYGKLDVLEPIDGYLTKEDWDDFSPAIQGAMKYSDKTYLWPWLKLVSAVAVNMDLVKEKGVENLFPFNSEIKDWSYDEFLTAAKALTFSRSGKSEPDVYGYAVYGKDSMFYNYLFAIANGASILDPTFKNYTFKSKEAIDGLQFLSDLVNVHKVAPKGAAGLTYQNVYDMFLQQKIAMIPYTPEIADEAKKAEKPFNVEFVAPPHGNGRTTVAWNNVGGFLVFKQDDSYKKDIVMEFGKLLISPENSKVLSTIGCFPSRKSAGNIYQADNKVMSYFSMLSDYGSSEFSRSFGLVAVPDWELEMQSLLLGAKTPEQVLDVIGTKISEALTK